MDEELRAAAHVVGRGRVQVIGIRIALVGEHVAQGVGSLRKGSDVFLALARWVVAARPGRTTAATGGINPGTVVGGAIEVVAALGVGVRAAGGGVQGS